MKHARHIKLPPDRADIERLAAFDLINDMRNAATLARQVNDEQRAAYLERFEAFKREAENAITCMREIRPTPADELPKYLRRASDALTHE